jgi:ABC-type oligopeptide transport system substrate-binding subunit
MKKKLFSVLILVICTLSFGLVAAADNEEAAIEAYGRDLAQIVGNKGVDYSNPQPGGFEYIF